MLNFSPKIRQIYLCRIHLHGQLDGKHVRLRPPARAVAGHAAHGQRSLHHAKAEVICHLQPVFWHVENALNNFRQVTFWGITTFCHRQIWQVLRFYRIFVQCFVPERGCLPWFCITKIINSSQFVEIIKKSRQLRCEIVFIYLFLQHKINNLITHLAHNLCCLNLRIKHY